MAFETSATPGCVESFVIVFRRQREFAEHCFDQLNDVQFFATVTPGINSVGQIAQHLAGNILSRWTDFLTSDGEKPWRDRESEFSMPAKDADLDAERRRIMAEWVRGWGGLEELMKNLTDGDLNRVVTIRGVAHSVVLAIARQIDHYGYHVGQIAMISRMHVGDERWRWFTIAPGQSETFNRRLKG